MTQVTGHSVPLVLDIIGVRVAVRVPRAELDGLRGALGRIVVGADDDATSPAAQAGPIDVDVTTAEEVLGRALLAAIEHSPHLLVHAGAVVRDGHVVLFPGVSGTGKSTLTAACLTRGFEYLSDEAVAVELGSGQVYGLSRPLMLTAWTVGALGLEPDEIAGKRAVPAEAIGASTAAGPLPVSHVVLARRGAEVSSLASIPAGDALAEVLASSFNHFKHQAAAWAAVTRLVSGARCWRLDVAEPMTAAEAVAGLFEAGHE